MGQSPDHESSDRELLGDDSGRDTTDRRTALVDLDFLRTQTFDDAELARELLALFVAQARRVIPTLPDLSPKAQWDAAHLLKGSARGIGAWDAARAAAAFEAAPAADRPVAYRALAEAFADATAAIENLSA